MPESYSSWEQRHWMLKPCLALHPGSTAPCAVTEDAQGGFGGCSSEGCLQLRHPCFWLCPICPSLLLPVWYPEIVRLGEYTGVCVLHETFSAQALGSVSTWSLHPWARSLLLHRSCQNCALWKNCCLLVYRQGFLPLSPIGL